MINGTSERRTATSLASTRHVSGQSTSTVPVTLSSTAASLIVSWNKATRLLAAFALSGLLPASYKQCEAGAVTECPAVYKSKPLRNFDVFDGNPAAGGQPQAPEHNRWDILPLPRSLWSRYSPFYLGCKYEDDPDLLAVEIPRSARRCEIGKSAHIECR